MKKSTIILITMLATAAVAVVFGLYVMKQRISTPPTTQNNSDQTQTPTQDSKPAEEETPVTASTAGWKTYTNDKHGFTVQYPPYLKAGAVSDNSVLGTAQVPVRGLHVGPLVLVALEDKSLQKDAKEYFDSVYDAAVNPPSPTAQEGDGPGPIECTIDKITNTNVVSIKSVSCNGEGGAAKYAYVTGKTYDVFVDGYSKGYDDSASGEFTSTIDYATVLSTFIFTKDMAAASLTLNPTPTPNPTSIQNFSITADDTSATPSMVMVTKGAIVEITFNVSSVNVANAGLDFRSSAVNTGTISGGQTKTISFTANSSFDFTPYSPGSSVAKNYKISVMVE